jgi:hypothetical protein
MAWDDIYAARGLVPKWVVSISRFVPASLSLIFTVVSSGTSSPSSSTRSRSSTATEPSLPSSSFDCSRRLFSILICSVSKPTCVFRSMSITQFFSLPLIALTPGMPSLETQRTLVLLAKSVSGLSFGGVRSDLPSPSLSCSLVYWPLLTLILNSLI